MSEIKTKVASCDNCEYQKECLEKPPCILDAYEQGRADERAKVIEEIETKLYEYGFIWTEHAENVWEDIAEQLKEQSNESIM